MSRPTLYIGNKNYSSWSFRAWIGLRAKGIDFDENLQLFDDETRNRHFLKFSPTGKVPVLVDEGVTIWDSLAILEYAADKHPEKGFWPSARKHRAVARSVANEMHSGHPNLRASCPMNIRRRPAAIETSDAVLKDVRRVESVWSRCLSESGGPFLFGEFTVADAMYAPVVNRFAVYELSKSDDTARYSAAMTALPAWREWETAARVEPWTVPSDEV